jgi:hypothetical protein
MTSAALAADPTFSFSSNEGQKSFLLEISNSTDKDVVCKVEISAEIGTIDCEKIVDTYTYTSSNLIVKSNGKVTNPTFGIDRLASINSRYKKAVRVFCGEPRVETTCK